MNRFATVIAVILATTVSAQADERWTTSVDAPAAIPVSRDQGQLFDWGAIPGVSLYMRVSNRVQLGAKLRAGVLANGPAPTQAGFEDPGYAGIAGASIPLRYTAWRSGSAHLWIETAVGGVVTGDNARPTVEFATGYAIKAGPVSLGPSVRYLHVTSPGGAMSRGDAQLILAGIEFSITSGSAPKRPRLVSRPPPPPRPTSDRDILIDVDHACSPVSGDPSCETPATATETASSTEFSRTGRYVLPDRIFFDSERARVKSRGRAILARIVRSLRARGDWTAIRVEGHADLRGPDDYNDWLSKERATRVARELASLGLAGRVTVVGFGRKKPLANESSDEAHQRNRRVELVLVTNEPAVAQKGDSQR